MELKPSEIATLERIKECEESNNKRCSHISPDNANREDPGPLMDLSISARTGEVLRKSEENILMPWEGGKL